MSISIHVTKRNDVVVRVARVFFTAFRRFTATPKRRCTIRVGTFEMYEVRRGLYRATPDVINEASRLEAQTLAMRVAEHWKCMELHGAIFAEPNSYHAWYNLVRRIPTLSDLTALACQKGLRIPDVAVKFPAADPKKLAALANLFRGRSHARA